MARPAPKAKPKLFIPESLSEPRVLDPISGKPLEIVELSNGNFQVRGDGWVGTRLFQFRNQAVWWVSHNLGVAPSFPSPYPKIEIAERVAPDALSKAAVDSDNSATETLAGIATETMFR